MPTHSTRRLCLSVFLVLLVGWGLSVTPAATQQAAGKQPRESIAAAGSIQHVIIVSVDGMMPETYLNPDAHGLQVPTLREILRQGAYSEGALGVFPPVTYPSHTSIATGTNPARHGILANAPWDPLGQLPRALRWYAQDIRVPTLWDAAGARGLKTALIYWPVTLGARASANVPEFWRQDPGTPEDAKLNWAISTPGLLDAVAKRFPDFRKSFLPPRVPDEASTDIAVHLIETLKPNLLLLHIFDVDHWQHEDGPLAGRALAALETADKQVARLIAAAKNAGIWSETALVVVSDHGHARYQRRIRPGIWLRKKGLLTLDEKNKITDWKAWLLPSTGSAYVYVKDESDEQTRRTLLEIFRKAAASPGKTGIRQVLTREQIAALGGDPQAFLAVEAAEGWAIVGGYRGKLVSPATTAAGHGYLPERPAMRPSLLFYGPAVVPGKIEGARLIDVAPTVARWLGVNLDKAEGKPLPVPLR